MVVLAAVACFLSLVQGPPAGQNFNFSAQFDMRKSTVRLLASRTLAATPRSAPVGGRLKRTVYPPYSWSIPAGNTALRFVPLSGQHTMPRVNGVQAAWPAPAASVIEVNGVSAEGCNRELAIDWRGCQPGFYRMEASATFQGQDRTWTMAFVHQEFYWRPMPKLPPMLRPGQEFLVTARRLWRTRIANSGAFVRHYGSTLRLASAAKDRFQVTARLSGGADTFDLGFTSPDYPAEGVEPVFRDAEARGLAKTYVGKTVYPMGLYLDIMSVEGDDRLMRLKRGKAAVVIRDIWRAARPRGLGHIDPTIIGDSDRFLTGWFPLFVVFEVDPKQAFDEAPDSPDSHLFIAEVADRWAFDRTFSPRPKMAEFPGWKPRQGLTEPIFAEVGMSPRQLAWVHSWPAFVGPVDQTVRLDEWRYEPYKMPVQIFRFRNGGLLAGLGVVPKR